LNFDVPAAILPLLYVQDGGLFIDNATLNFSLPSAAKDTARVIVEDPGQTAQIRDSVVNVEVRMPGGVALPVGTRFKLVEAPDGLSATNVTLGSGVAKSGVSVVYQLGLETLPDLLSAVITGAGQATDDSKSLLEGGQASLGLLNQGANLAAGTGMDEALWVSRDRLGLTVFGIMSGSTSMRYYTGSHVDMESLSLMSGAVYGFDLNPGRLTLGAFIEHGNGSYDTYNSFSNAASVHGNGDVEYTGGGILGHLRFAESRTGHFYSEVSLRAGGVHNSYQNYDLRDAYGRAVSYESSSVYYGFHLGAGYVWKVSEGVDLDFYGKAFWTRQEGDSVTLSTGDKVSFRDADSSRVRLGSRFTHIANDYISPYIGLAYEYEFDGKGRASTSGFEIDPPSLQGSSAIGEIGANFRPSLNVPLSFDVGLQGYVGKMEGITGTVHIKLEF
jgi:hypothetical protein